MKVKVTKKDIQFGVPGNDEFCPVALAMKRASHRKVSVDANSSGILVDGKWAFYDMPDAANKFICEFDTMGRIVHSVRREDFKPFTFNLGPRR
jgi:hypothetical protein